LSRATSAFSREDLLSAQLFTIVALENILRVLIEIALEPFSNSRFLEKLDVSVARLGMRNLVDEYLDVAGLNRADEASAKERLRLFRLIWDEMKVVAEQNPRVLGSSHFRVKSKLNYYLNPAFLQGLVLRMGSLIDSGAAAEAMRCLSSVFLDIAENYVWLKSLIDGVGVDFSLLLRSLECLERRSPRDFGCVVEFLGLGELDKFGVGEVIEKVREVMFRVRGERKVLIKKHLIRG
jgi:hypothetical protein